jgi:hypothetical protein
MNEQSTKCGLTWGYNCILLDVKMNKTLSYKEWQCQRKRNSRERVNERNKLEERKQVQYICHLCKFQFFYGKDAIISYENYEIRKVRKFVIIISFDSMGEFQRNGSCSNSKSFLWGP